MLSCYLVFAKTDPSFSLYLLHFSVAEDRTRQLPLKDLRHLSDIHPSTFPLTFNDVLSPLESPVKC